MRRLSRALALVLFGVLAAAPAFAARGWFSSATCQGALTAPTLSKTTPIYFCIDSLSSLNAFSASATTGAVESFTIERTGDSSQSGAGVCAVEPYRLVGVSAGTAISSSTGFSMISADTDLDGAQNDLSLNGAASRRMLYGVSARGITLKITAIAAGSEQCVIAVYAGQ